MWKIIYGYIFVFSLLLSYVLSYFLRKVALRFDVVDKPDQKRKIHSAAVPLLGGVGIYCAFTLSIFLHLILIVLLAKSPLVPDTVTRHIGGMYSKLGQLAAIAGTTSILVIVGLIDDIKRISARKKLLFQVILAGIVFASGIRISLFVPNFFISALFTLLWIIGITNAFNLMDNMDGLSCGTALMATAIFFVVASSSGQFFVATILACFGGVLAGFLPFNFPPARMFMGDAGSLFIGYTLSILTIINTYYTQENPTPAAVTMPLLILAVPIFDTLSVMYIRFKNKVSIFQADKNHFSHRLVKLGLTSRTAVFFIYLVNFCIGLGALLLASLNAQGCLIILLQAVCILSIIVILEKVKQCSS